MYVLRNTVALSRNQLLQWITTMHFLSIVDLCITANNIKVLSLAQQW
jgi:hypothetical protein